MYGPRAPAAHFPVAATSPRAGERRHTGARTLARVRPHRCWTRTAAVLLLGAPLLVTFPPPRRDPCRLATMPWPNGGCPGKPTLRLTFDDGSAKTLLPADDTHIWAGPPRQRQRRQVPAAGRRPGQGPVHGRDEQGLPAVRPRRAAHGEEGRADADRQGGRQETGHAVR